MRTAKKKKEQTGIMKNKFSISKILISAMCLILMSLTCMSCVSLDGKSAYDLAVENGFDGSLEEWLGSLDNDKDKDDAESSGNIGDTNASDNDSSTSATGNNDITIESSPSDITFACAKGLLSSVKIVCTSNVSSWYGSSSGSAGSGVIYKIDKSLGNALIITNYHVVYDASSRNDRISDDIKVYLYGSETSSMAIDASYVGGSMYYDIAVLYVENSDIIKNSSAEAATFANSDALHVGETAIAIGNPENGGISVSNGIISKESEYITMMSVDNTTSMSLRVIRVDTAVNSGNSGGGLFNCEGNLIGIVNAKNNESQVENIGYAIPSNVARAVADNIIYYCADGTHSQVMRAIVGITVEVASSIAKYNTENGLVDIIETIKVNEVTNGSLCDGHLAAGDTLVSITVGGSTTNITRQHHIIDAMLDARAGDTVTFSIIRNGQSMDVNIVITESCLTEY